jgi:hypothetical protein
MKRLWILFLLFGWAIASAEDINVNASSGSQANAQTNVTVIPRPEANAGASAGATAVSLGGEGRGGEAQALQGQSLTYAPTSKVENHPPAFPMNGIASPVPGPQIFGPLSTGSNGSLVQSAAWLRACKQVRKQGDQKNKELRQRTVSSDDDLVLMTYTPHRNYVAWKQTRDATEEAQVYFEEIPNNDEKAYICLGSLLVQADESEDPHLVTLDTLVAAAMDFTLELKGFREIYMIMTRAGMATEQGVNTSGFGVTLSPGGSGAGSGSLFGGMGSVSFGDATTLPQTKVGAMIYLLAAVPRSTPGSVKIDIMGEMKKINLDNLHTPPVSQTNGSSASAERWSGAGGN